MPCRGPRPRTLSEPHKLPASRPLALFVHAALCCSFPLADVFPSARLTFLAVFLNRYCIFSSSCTRARAPVFAPVLRMGLVTCLHISTPPQEPLEVNALLEHEDVDTSLLIRSLMPRQLFPSDDDESHRTFPCVALYPSAY